jgi:hypothetical protein
MSYSVVSAIYKLLRQVYELTHARNNLLTGGLRGHVLKSFKSERTTNFDTIVGDDISTHLLHTNKR